MFATFLVFIVVIIFICVKGYNLVLKQNPTITEAIVPSYFDTSYKFNFEENHFHIAFGIEGTLNHTAKDDPNFVTWEAVLTEEIDGEREVKKLSIHKCD